MPKVYASQADRQKARMTAAIYAQMKLQKVSTTMLGDAWGISQPAAARRVREGIVSCMDLWNAQPLLRFTDQELAALIRGDRKPIEIVEIENGGSHADQSNSRRYRNR